jgi:hypothetical protein
MEGLIQSGSTLFLPVRDIAEMARTGSTKNVIILVQVDRVEFKNPNVPHGHDPIDLSYWGFFLVCRLEIGLEIDLLRIKKGPATTPNHLFYLLVVPRGLEPRFPA